MKYLYVGATPEVDREAFQAIRDRVATEFGLPVREMELPSVDFAYDAGRGQYGSIQMLEALAQWRPPDGVKLLGLTERDLFIPVLTFVFGQAQLGGRVGAVSLARLRQEFYGLEPNRAVFLERSHKEVLHEAGHLFGLVHCAERSCAMSLATNVRQIDRKLAAYCPPCAARLRRGARE